VTDGADTAAARLRRRYLQASSGTEIGGAGVLRQLSDLAEQCSVVETDRARAAVAFTLCTIFALHADDRDDRAVTGDDTYVLMSAAADDFAAAIKFIGTGGGSDEAIQLIASLARLTPKILYGH
jgi:hypothetical protein